MPSTLAKLLTIQKPSKAHIQKVCSKFSYTVRSKEAFWNWATSKKPSSLVCSITNGATLGDKSWSFWAAPSWKEIAGFQKTFEQCPDLFDRVTLSTAKKVPERPKGPDTTRTTINLKQLGTQYHQKELFLIFKRTQWAWEKFLCSYHVPQRVVDIGYSGMIFNPEIRRDPSLSFRECIL